MTTSNVICLPFGALVPALQKRIYFGQKKYFQFLSAVIFYVFVNSWDLEMTTVALHPKMANSKRCPLQWEAVA